MIYLRANVRLYAVEEGWPFVGMAPELLKLQFGADPLFDKHGGPFVINAGVLGGRAVCLRDADAILEVQLQKADVLEISLLGAPSSSGSIAAVSFGLWPSLRP
jgi:hypothetical protein